MAPNMEKLREAADRTIEKIKEEFRKMDLSQEEMMLGANIGSGLAKGLSYGLATTLSLPKNTSRISKIISIILRAYADALDEVEAGREAKPTITH